MELDKKAIGERLKEFALINFENLDYFSKELEMSKQALSSFYNPR